MVICVIDFLDFRHIIIGKPDDRTENQRQGSGKLPCRADCKAARNHGRQDTEAHKITKRINLNAE